MSEKTVTSDLEELTRDGDEVVTTVYELGSVEIKLSTKNDLSLLSVAGSYSSAVGREIERIARPCHGSIGLEFREGEGIARRALTFDSSILRLLKLLKEKCERNGETFFLCAPPPRLEDVLKLAGVYEKYAIVDRSGAISSAGRTPRKQESRERRGEGQPSSHLPPDDAQTAQKKIFQLNQTLKRTASLEKGLDSAEKCVKKFLPQKPPTANGYEFAFFYRSSEKVGGDFFDFVEIDEETVGISIGDVSGHGIDSAIIMGITKKLINIRSRDTRFASPGEVLKQVNADVTPDLERQSFVTALYGEIHKPSGSFRFARAGHETPILFRPGRGHRNLSSRGVALGLASQRYFDAQIEDAVVTLEPGWSLLLCTDGLAECRNAKGARYSRERLSFELSALKTGGSPPEILAHVVRKIEEFAGGWEQEDDMTAILIRRVAGSAAVGPHRTTTSSGGS